MHLGSVCPMSKRTDDRLPPNKPYRDSSRKLILGFDGSGTEVPTAVVSPASCVERSVPGHAGRPRTGCQSLTAASEGQACTTACSRRRPGGS
jgi:hypothetical protein